ncbi:MAG: HAMP domain-containing protein [Anaerolineae bacterium]|nr:HAMP domain-containing protein [Anaerolineae bacterium]
MTLLRAQAISLILILLVLMVALTLGVTFLAYRQVSQSLAESRDQELVTVGAERLSKRMETFMLSLSTLADQPEMQTGDPTVQQQVLERIPDLIADFTNRDGGVIILNATGFVSVTKPFRPDLIGQDFSKEPYFQDAQALRPFTFSNILKEPGTHQNMIVIAVPIINANGDFIGAIAGRFYIDYQGLGRDIQQLQVGEKGFAYLADQNGRLIYHPVDSLIGTDFSQREAVQRLQAGDREGAITTVGEDGLSRTVEGFAVVPITGWGLVIGEPWDQVVAPALTSLRPVAIVLIIGLILVAGVVSIGVQRVTDPIQNLVMQTRQVTAGDYDAQVTLSRIKEIRELGTEFNEMVQQIRKYRAGVRQYVADITRSQEEERKRVARELHDDTVQSLIAINQRLELLRNTLDDDPEAVRERLMEVKSMVTGAIASVRQFSRDLRPLALEDLGLTAAIQYLVNQLSQGGAIETTLEVEGEVDDLSADMEVAVYRILQEALNNIKKHAQANQVKVVVQFTKSQVKLVVRDNGRGFEVPESLTDFASDGHFGIMGLQERAQLFGGHLSVQSEPLDGTVIRIVMPRQSEASPFASFPSLIASQYPEKPVKILN